MIKLGKFIGLTSAFAIIIFLSFGTSWWLQLWDGYPRGADSVSHLVRTNQILEFWPHFWWFHTWSGGTPHFFWYPSLTYLVLALAKSLTSLDLNLLLSLFGVVSIAIAAIAVYLLVFELTGALLLSLAGAIIYIITPGTWVSDFSMGTYSRGISIAFMGLAMWATIRWLKTLKSGKESRWVYFWTVIFLGFAFLSHYNGGPQAFLAVFLLIAFGTNGWHQRIVNLLKIFLPANLLVSVFSFPLIFSMSPAASMTVGHATIKFSEMFLPWSALFYVFTGDNIRGFAAGLFRLSPLLLPLLLLIMIAVLVLRRNALRTGNFAFRIFLALGIFTAVLIIYGTVYFPFLKHYGSGVFDPRMTVMFFPTFLAPMVAISISWLSNKRSFQELGGLILIILSAGWFLIQFPWVGKPNIVSAQAITRLGLPKELSDGQFNYRVGTGNYSNIAAPFNYRYPYVPQTRDYFATGVVIPDYYIYLALAGWRWPDNYPETNFLFDWWGVKQFVVMDNEPWAQGDPLTKFRKFPDLYPLEGDNGSFSQFVFKEATPILAATNAPSALIIGATKTKAYNLMIRTLAQANINSRYLIPVDGGEYIDSYDTAELKKFPLIILYDYNFKDPTKAASLLKTYVEGGGGLVIEANKAIELGRQGVNFPSWPVSATAKSDFGKEWQFSHSTSENEILSGINFQKFAPPVFADGPWGVTYADEIKDWAKPILFDGGKPVVVAGKFGQGRVVWSGLNLPYHVVTYNSYEESRFLGNMLTYALGKKTEAQPLVIGQFSKDANSKKLFFDTNKYSVEFTHPERRVVTSKAPSNGVLFKEAYYQNWQAVLNGNNSKIYKAGPGFMYVPIPNSRVGDQVIFEFGTNRIQWAGYTISLASLFGLVLYLLRPEPFKAFSNKLGSLSFSSGKKLILWWEKDET